MIETKDSRRTGGKLKAKLRQIDRRPMYPKICRRLASKGSKNGGKYTCHNA